MAWVLALPTVRPPFRSAFFAPARRKRQVGVEHVLDPEEHVAEAGVAHLAGEIVAAGEHRRRHALHDVVDVVQPGVGDSAAQRAEARDVQA